MFFVYKEPAVSYFRQRDKRLCKVMNRIGHIDRAGLVGSYHIVYNQRIADKLCVFEAKCH